MGSISVLQKKTNKPVWNWVIHLHLAEVVSQKSAGLWVLFAWLWLTMASRSPEMSWRMDLRRSKGHKDINEDGTNFKTEVIDIFFLHLEVS